MNISCYTVHLRDEHLTDVKGKLNVCPAATMTLKVTVVGRGDRREEISCIFLRQGKKDTFLIVC
jgi:hypothetical protein